MRLRMHMDLWRVMIGGVRSLLRFGGAMSLQIWSLVRFFGGFSLKQQPPSLLLSSLLSLLTCMYACVLDGNLVLVPLVSRGMEKNNSASVHAGFLISYNSVRAVVVHVLREQLLAFPNYTVVITGSFPLFLLSYVLVNG